MSSYVQLVTESTEISGALLDHVFIRKDLFKKKIEISVVRTSDFSDHNVVVLTLLFKSKANNIENVIAV